MGTLPFINTAGLTIFGDGSQWFWSMLAFLAIPVTGFLIFSQLRGQRSASAVDQVESFNREATSEQMNRHVVDLLIALRDHKDPANLPKAATLAVATFWETFAGLARAGYRDPKVMWLVDGTSAQLVWAWLEPWAQMRRAETGRPDLWEALSGWRAEWPSWTDERAGRLLPLPMSPVRPSGS